MRCILRHVCCIVLSSYNIHHMILYLLYLKENLISEVNRFTESVKRNLVWERELLPEKLRKFQQRNYLGSKILGSNNIPERYSDTECSINTDNRLTVHHPSGIVPVQYTILNIITFKFYGKFNIY